MKDLEQQKTILYGLEKNHIQYHLKKQPQAAHISYKQEMVGKQYGWVKIISPEKRWNVNWSHCYVLVQCINCKEVKWISLSSIKRGKSKGRQKCSQPRKIPIWLSKRLAAAKQRCENPKDKGYPKYGGRGIEFQFGSVLEAGFWIMENLENVTRDMEMDRINTNGHYAKGNIRFVKREVNQGNRRLTVLSDWRQNEWPYSRGVVTRMLSKGMTRKEIIESAQNAVIHKRKKWRLIQARLEFMTLEMQEGTTVLPYRTV